MLWNADTDPVMIQAALLRLETTHEELAQRLEVVRSHELARLASPALLDRRGHGNPPSAVGFVP